MPLLDLQEELREKAGTPKIAFTPPAPIAELEAKIHEVADAGLREAFSIKDKMPRREARKASSGSIAGPAGRGAASGMRAASCSRMRRLCSISSMRTR